jgi:hypothetical protein
VWGAEVLETNPTCKAGTPMQGRYLTPETEQYGEPKMSEQPLYGYYSMQGQLVTRPEALSGPRTGAEPVGRGILPPCWERTSTPSMRPRGY